MSERAAPFYCPYCGDEDLRPSEEGPGVWECAACNRAFRLKFLGLLSRGLARPPHGGGEGDHDGDHDGEGGGAA
ncbi:hypothetical protein PJ985_16630 [Streptomyces sp. ACA25]|uniref:hypothetical protein n=1 Tax=Streptomyces sp. ACA25 TaxID=3022596 RepID=UPI00230712A8|nr:hypothetical protein [Streptomyces sp. ACA25]MDB1089189.1 hypothetical protein [Streptomyces sp. ACA25]